MTDIIGSAPPLADSCLNDIVHDDISISSRPTHITPPPAKKKRSITDKEFDIIIYQILEWKQTLNDMGSSVLFVYSRHSKLKKSLDHILPLIDKLIKAYNEYENMSFELNHSFHTHIQSLTDLLQISNNNRIELLETNICKKRKICPDFEPSEQDQPLKKIRKLSFETHVATPPKKKHTKKFTHLKQHMILLFDDIENYFNTLFLRRFCKCIWSSGFGKYSNLLEEYTDQLLYMIRRIQQIENQIFCNLFIYQPQRIAFILLTERNESEATHIIEDNNYLDWKHIEHDITHKCDDVDPESESDSEEEIDLNLSFTESVSDKSDNLNINTDD